MQTTLIPDVYNKVINALKQYHPEYMENINELAKIWKENLIKRDITLTEKLNDVVIEPQNSREPYDDSVSEVKSEPYILSDAFKRVKLPTKGDCRPPKRGSIPIPQYDGSNGMLSDDETNDYNKTDSVNEKEAKHNDVVDSDTDLLNEEDENESFSSSNVVVCQYSQYLLEILFSRLLKRAHKWKMKLSKGICYINSKNYVFGSCEADFHTD